MHQNLEPRNIRQVHRFRSKAPMTSPATGQSRALARRRNQAPPSLSPYSPSALRTPGLARTGGPPEEADRPGPTNPSTFTRIPSTTILDDASQLEAAALRDQPNPQKPIPSKAQPNVYRLTNPKPRTRLVPAPRPTSGSPGAGTARST